MEVAELFAALGIKIDKASWDRANGAIQSMGKALGGMVAKAQNWGRSLSGVLVKAAAGLGIAKLVTTGLKFNSTIEETRNQIAGMLALTKKTDLNDQLGVANTLMDNLRARAAKLPGTTAEYVAMLSRLTQPVTDAGLGLQDLEDITVNSVVGAKALGVAWDVAARDIDQALRGQFHSVDQFTGKLLGARGFKGEEGRSRFNAMSARQRAQIIKDALMQKQLTQLAAAQGATAAGKWSTFIDTAQQTLGRVMAPLFARLVQHLEKINAWLEKNQAKVTAFAKTVGDVLVTAIDAVVETIEFLAENKELAIALAAIAAAFLLISSPVLLVVAAVVALILIIKKLGPVFEAVKRTVVNVFREIDRAFTDITDSVDDLFTVFAAPWIAAFEAIRSGFAAAWNWIGARIEQLKSAAGWLLEKVERIARFVGINELAPSSVSERINQAPGVTAPGARPVYAPGFAGAGAPGGPVTNTLTLNPTIEINGVTDPQTVGSIVEQKMRQVASDAYSTLRGGRR